MVAASSVGSDFQRLYSGHLVSSKYDRFAVAEVDESCQKVDMDVWLSLERQYQPVSLMRQSKVMMRRRFPASVMRRYSLAPASQPIHRLNLPAPSSVMLSLSELASYCGDTVASDASRGAALSGTAFFFSW